MGEEVAFLKDVVTPIYQVIAKEAERSKRGKSKHSQWRNFDNVNEYFWSSKCFQLGWRPMHSDEFFSSPCEESLFDEISGEKKPSNGADKVNFVEIRSFWHIFRSFDRLWIFFILCFQVCKKVSSIFITAAVSNLGQALLDLILSWKAWRSMSRGLQFRYFLKVASAAAWVIVLPITYAYTWKNPPGFVETMQTWRGPSPSYILAVGIYLLPNMLAGLPFLFPPIRRFVDRSNSKIVECMMWWSQPRLYVGRGMHVRALDILGYTAFWVLLIITKLAFTYYIEIKPLVGPTKVIMSAHITNVQWHEFSPVGISMVKRRCCADYPLIFRLTHGIIFTTCVTMLVFLILHHLTLRDIILIILAFMLTVWQILLIAQACKPLVRSLGLWPSVRTLARHFDRIMGLLLFTPIAFLAWFPFISEFQTRMLFNPAFSRGLQISRILGGKKKSRN